MFRRDGQRWPMGTPLTGREDPTRHEQVWRCKADDSWEQAMSGSRRDTCRQGRGLCGHAEGEMATTPLESGGVTITKSKVMAVEVDLPA